MQSRLQTAGYVATLATDLAGIAKTADLKVLAHLLEMAALEAKLEADELAKTPNVQTRGRSTE